VAEIKCNGPVVALGSFLVDLFWRAARKRSLAAFVSHRIGTDQHTMGTADRCTQAYRW